MDAKLKEKIKDIKLLLLDVDGVMTDGRIVIDDNGIESKFFNVRDGHGIKLLQRGGVKVGIITGRESRVVVHRAKELDIGIIYQGAKNKVEAYDRILADEGLEERETAYIGDDVVDLPVMKRAGFSVAVADASEHLFPYVDYIASGKGGRGAVREVTELILRGKGLWEEVMKRYFS